MNLLELFGMKKRTPSAVRETDTGPAEEELLPLETYGLYCRIIHRENGLTENRVFRFYETGAVLSVSLAQRKPDDGYFPKEQWFNRENSEDNSGGRWKRTGNQIRITVTLPRGNIIYSGTITEDGMVLNSRSEITGFRAENLFYKYYPFQEVPGWWD